MKRRCLFLTIISLCLFIIQENIYALNQFSKIKNGNRNWESMGSGVDRGVLTVACLEDDVYVGGGFFIAGGDSMHAIAGWNGTNWFPIFEYVSNVVLTIACSDNGVEKMVHVGGGFESVEPWGRWVDYFVTWFGTHWDRLGMGNNGGLWPGPCNSIAAIDSLVYIGGFFNMATDTITDNIVKLNCKTWHSRKLYPLGEGLPGIVQSIALSESDVYAGGVNIDFYGTVWKWNGSEWDTLSNDLNGNVYTVACNGNDVYVGGEFTHIGDTEVNYIAKWNGNTWSSIGNGVNNTVKTIVCHDDYVYVGGDFTQAGNLTVNHIARWDGHTWYTLGAGTNGRVNAIAFSGDDLYAGGRFSEAGGIACSNIAVWRSEKDINHHPVAQNDTIFIKQDSTVIINLLENDSDPDGDDLTITGVLDSGVSGTVVVNSGDTSVSYIPPVGFSGDVDFDYVVSDGNGGLDTATVFITVTPVSSVSDRAIPTAFALSQNFPNPFNPVTAISYDLPEKSLVLLRIFNVMGSEICTLVNEEKSAGKYKMIWNGQDRLGHPVGSGIYFYQLKAGSYTQIRKMLLVR